MASASPAMRIKTMSPTRWQRWFRKLVPVVIAANIVAVLVALMAPAVMEARRSAQASVTT
jgi:hypothetical protein